MLLLSLYTTRFLTCFTAFISSPLTSWQGQFVVKAFFSSGLCLMLRNYDIGGLGTIGYQTGLLKDTDTGWSGPKNHSLSGLTIKTWNTWNLLSGLILSKLGGPYSLVGSNFSCFTDLVQRIVSNALSRMKENSGS